ncbi:Protein phosphatase regulatory subunit Glc9 [Schizosaccharomyces pombe]
MKVKSILKHSRMSSPSLETDSMESGQQQNMVSSTPSIDMNESDCSGTGTPSEERIRRLRWDEENLSKAEQQKSAKMKITEPKTPFQRFLLPDDEVPEINLDETDSNDDFTAGTLGDTLGTLPSTRVPKDSKDDNVSFSSDKKQFYVKKEPFPVPCTEPTTSGDRYTVRMKAPTPKYSTDNHLPSKKELFPRETKPQVEVVHARINNPDDHLRTHPSVNNLGKDSDHADKMYNEGVILGEDEAMEEEALSEAEENIPKKKPDFNELRKKHYFAMAKPLKRDELESSGTESDLERDNSNSGSASDVNMNENE